MAGTEQQRRRFITRHDVEDAAAAGRSITVQARDVLTDEAAQRAMDLGVRVERTATAPTGSARGASGQPHPAPHKSAPSASVTSEELRRAVRAAVIAEMGEEPPGLDAAIERVLQRRSR